MAILQTGQTFSSGDQVTAQKLMDIADLATFSDPADGATIIANNATYGVDGGDGKLKVKPNGIGSNELLSHASVDANRAVTTNHIKDQAVTSAKLAPSAISSLMPTGTVMPFAGTALPNDDWLFCGGQSVAIADYQALYDTIGITYGGSGSNFNLPDLRGRVIAGRDDMNGINANRLTSSSAANLNGVALGANNGDPGDTGRGTNGSQEHTLTTSEIPGHTHYAVKKNSTDTDNYILAGDEVLAASGPASNINERYALTETTEGDPDTAITSSTGGDQAHNNVQPTIILNYIIKT
jgi:microcystin-dependent protein